MQKHMRSFEKRLYQIEEGSIRAIAADGDIATNKFLNKEETQCFGCALLNDKNGTVEYGIFYLFNEDQLPSGLLLKLSNKLKSRNYLTQIFAKLLVQDFPHLDLYQTFNAFQVMTAQLFEKLDFFVYDDYLIDTIEKAKKEGMEAIIMPVGHTRGSIHVPMITEEDIKTLKKRKTN